jgi:SAM-dependent methyltransferase
MTTRSGVRDHATEFFDDADAIAIEDGIWWAAGRRFIIRTYLDLMRSDIGAEGPLQILEIGCGSGGDLPLLAQYGIVQGLERSPILARRARRRGAASHVHESASLADCAASFGGVNVLCSFDVLEHIEDDDAFVRQMAATGRPDHWLLLSVPACPFLYGSHDVKLHHYRRYSRRSLTRLLERHGYEIVRSSYFMFLLFPVAVLARVAETIKERWLGIRSDAVSIGRVPASVNKALIRVLQLEARAGRHVRFPIGLWVFALARRRAGASS